MGKPKITFRVVYTGDMGQQPYNPFRNTDNGPNTFELGDEATDDTPPQNPFAPAPAPQKSGKGKWVVSVIVLLILAAGAAGFLYWQSGHNKAAQKPTSVQPTKTTQKPATKTIQTTPTKPYSSTGFALSLEYPETWSPAEAQLMLTIKSPVTQLTDSAGQTVSARVVLSIQNKSSSLEQFKQGSAVAVLPSEKITYSQPTPSQRANTYISYLQYASTTATGALDGMYITGDFGYQKGQYIPQTDIGKVDPLVTITFVQCTDSVCSAGTKPLSIDAAQWPTTTLAADAKKMLESLAFQ